MMEDLSIRPGFWPILALDHGLTGFGDAVPISSVPSLLAECRGSIGAVVLTYGLARIFRDGLAPIPMIVQCLGSPFDYSNVQVCGVEQALRIGAKGVAVQINFSLPGELLTQQIETISKIVDQSHASDIPILFMVASERLNSLYDLHQSIRFCHELGADLIKVRPKAKYCTTESDVSECVGVLANSPPVLMAGGSENDDIVKEVGRAKRLGFSGYCIGRNIYGSADPAEMMKALYDAWNG